MRDYATLSNVSVAKVNLGYNEAIGQREITADVDMQLHELQFDH